MVRKLILLVAAVAAFATPAAADIVMLHDGRVIERPKIKVAGDVVEVTFENGVVKIPRKMIAEVIAEGGPAFEPKTDEEKAKAAKGLVPFEGRWMKREQVKARIDKRIAERKARVAEIREHMLWRNRWRDKTKHFEFEYTVPPPIYEYYSALMEAYYDLFAKTWKIKQPKDLGKLRVCFYTDAEKFQQIGGAGRGVLGYFRFVKPLELNFYYNRLNGHQTEQVMYHEVNHYLQKLMNPDFSMPHFPGESIAEYYGSGKFDPKTKKLTVGHILEGRLAQVKMDITGGDTLGLEKMITTARMYEHYTWGWTLVHWLMQDKKTGRAFEKWVKKLVHGKVKRVDHIAGLRTVPADEVWATFKKAFKLKTDDDVKKFEAAWHKFIKEEMHVTSSRGLEDAAFNASYQNLNIKAKRLFKEAIEKGSTSAQVYLKYAGYLRRDGNDAESRKMLQKAVELAPLEARVYSALGRALISDDKKEEGRKMLKLALELDPDDPWLALEVESALED